MFQFNLYADKRIVENSSLVGDRAHRGGRKFILVTYHTHGVVIIYALPTTTNIYVNKCTKYKRGIHHIKITAENNNCTGVENLSTF